MPIIIKELLIKGRLMPPTQPTAIDEAHLNKLLQQMEERVLAQCLEQLRDKQQREQQVWQFNEWRYD